MSATSSNNVFAITVNFRVVVKFLCANVIP
nr:MAG TPA: hypothetical protein [Caudoviricetes sp.]